MPYSSIGELPDKVKSKLSKHGQEIFVAAFNNALKEYEDESRAFATAYAAAKKGGGYKSKIHELAEGWGI